MKKFTLILALLLILPGCSSLSSNLIDAKKEATEAVNNLTKDAIEKKELLETKIDQATKAAESISNAINAVDQASEDIKALTGSNESEEE